MSKATWYMPLLPRGVSCFSVVDKNTVLLFGVLLLRVLIVVRGRCGCYSGTITKRLVDHFLTHLL